MVLKHKSITINPRKKMLLLKKKLFKGGITSLVYMDEYILIYMIFCIVCMCVRVYVSI